MSGWGDSDDIVIPKQNKQKQAEAKSKPQQQQQQQQPQVTASGYQKRFFSKPKEELKKIDFEKEEKGEKTIILRSRMGVYVSNYYLPSSQDKPPYFKKIEEDASHMQISKDGQIGLFSGTNWVVTIDLRTYKVIAEISDLVSVQNIEISQTQKYMQYMDRETKDRFIIKIMTFPDLQHIKSFEDKVYVKENWPPIKLTENDEIAFKYHYEKKVINLFKFNQDKVEVLRQYKVGVVDHFSVAPGNLKNPIFSVCSVEKQRGYDKIKGGISIYEFNSDKPVVQQQLEKAQEINDSWSQDGQNCLIKVECMQDVSNQSYYGENRLYHFGVQKKEFKQVPTYKGPVHDYKWAPDSKHFCVVSGFIPSKTVLFKNTCEPEFEFGQHYRNFCTFSNLNRFLIIAGFGNLNGEVDIWDIKEKKQIGKCKSSSAASCIWSNDGRKFLTGTLTPRLRVDNNFKVFKYDGTLLHKSDFNNTELYEVQWLNTEQIKYQDRPASPNCKKFEEEKQEEKKTFKAFGGGGGSFAEQMRAAKEGKIQQESRNLTGNKDFGTTNLQGNGQKLKPGQSATQEEPKQKKKRIRKKDMQKLQENLDADTDNL